MVSRTGSNAAGIHSLYAGFNIAIRIINRKKLTFFSCMVNDPVRPSMGHSFHLDA